MELEAVEKMLKESPAYEVRPGNYIMLFDINTWSTKKALDVAKDLMDQFGMKVVVLMHDAHYVSEPIQLYKVSA